MAREDSAIPGSTLRRTSRRPRRRGLPAGALGLWLGPALLGLIGSPAESGPGPGSPPIATADTLAPVPLRYPLPFSPGEELNFAVKYGVIRAGDAQLAVHAADGKGEDGAYRFTSVAQSSRFFSTFFEVKDRVESVWSPVTRLPIRFEKRIREGSYRKDVCVRFDHVNGVAVDDKGHRREVLVGSQDVLSAFFVVRGFRLAPGDSLEIPNHADGKNYMLTVKAHRRESIEVPAGRFNCIVVEPMLKTAGLFKQEGRLLIWLTEDSRRMPVRMESKVAVGAIVAELESFRMGRPPQAVERQEHRKP